MAPAAALLLALTLRAEVQVDAGARIEASARRSDPPAVAGERSALDLTALPRLGVSVSGGGATASAVYSPRFSLLAVGPHQRRDLLHGGELRAQLARGAAFRLEAFGTGALGRTDLVTERLGDGAGGAGGGSGGSPGGGGGTGTTTLLSTQQIELERWRTGGSLSVAPDRRTELFLLAAIGQDGGTDPASRAVYPVARALDATAELRWSASRVDKLGLLLAANRTRIAQARADSAWASALVTWRRGLAPRTEAWSGAGVVWLESRVPATAPEAGRTGERRLSPAAQLGVARPPGGARDVSGELAGTVGASVDRLTGRALPQVEAHALLRWPWTPVVALAGRGSGSLSWSSRGRTWIGQAEAGLSFTLLPRLRLEVGGNATRQRSTDPAVGRLDSYAATLALSADAPPARF